MKIAVFMPNWIGDAVMATPVLRALRTEYREAEIVAVLRPYIADVLAGLDSVDRTIAWNPRGKDSRQHGLRLAAQLRRERFDLALLLPNSLRSGIIAWMSGATRRIGFARNGRRWLLTDPVVSPTRGKPSPVIDEYLRLAECAGGSVYTRSMELAVLPEDLARLDQFWKRQPAGLRQRGVICLNPGGAFGAAKHWPTTSFAQLARRITNELGRTALVLHGPAERETALEIVRQAAHPHVLTFDDIPSIGLSKAAVRESQLLITTDSGPRHFAPPFEVPVVTLFGPTHIAWSETYYGKAVHLQIPVDCGPCQQRICPLQHHRCMRDLSVDQVFDASVALLERFHRHAMAS